MTDLIAIVGTGPTGLSTLQPLIAARPAAITLSARGDTARIGMPYSPETASRAIPASIASIKIPPIIVSYLDWLRDQRPAGSCAAEAEPG